MKYFVNIVPSLGITFFHENNDNINNDNIDNIIIKFESHQNIVVIKEQMKKYNKTFTFDNVTTGKVASVIKKLNSKKASKSDDVPTKVIKEFGTFFAEFLSKNVNSSLETGSFPEDLKCAEIVPIYKKNDKSNYRPISLLSYPTFQKFMKGACKNNLMNISVIYYQNISVVSDKVMELRIVYWL